MIVKEIDLFKGVDFEVMKELAGACTEESHPTDTTLFEKGDRADWLYVLDTGTVNLVIRNGATLTYSLSEPGEVFGWSSMVEEGRYTSSAVCRTGVRVVKIEKEKLERVFHAHPEVGVKVLRRLGGVFAKRLTGAYRDLLSSRAGEGGADEVPYDG